MLCPHIGPYRGTHWLCLFIFTDQQFLYHVHSLYPQWMECANICTDEPWLTNNEDYLHRYNVTRYHLTCEQHTHTHTRTYYKTNNDTSNTGYSKLCFHYALIHVHCTFIAPKHLWKGNNQAFCPRHNANSVALQTTFLTAQYYLRAQAYAGLVMVLSSRDRCHNHAIEYIFCHIANQLCRLAPLPLSSGRRWLPLPPNGTSEAVISPIESSDSHFRAAAPLGAKQLRTVLPPHHHTCWKQANGIHSSSRMEVTGTVNFCSRVLGKALVFPMDFHSPVRPMMLEPDLRSIRAPKREEERIRVILHVNAAKPTICLPCWPTLHAHLSSQRFLRSFLSLPTTSPYCQLRYGQTQPAQSFSTPVNALILYSPFPGSKWHWTQWEFWVDVHKFLLLQSDPNYDRRTELSFGATTSSVNCHGLLR